MVDDPPIAGRVDAAKGLPPAVASLGVVATPRPVRTALAVGETRVHRFQVLREHRGDGAHEDWIVVGFAGDALELASVGFDWSRTVPASAVAAGTFEPLTAGGVPVWGY